jgi:hypothetical protein
MQPDSPTSRRHGLLLAVVLLTVSASPALAANPKGPGDWRFDAELYGWAAGIGADLSRSGAAWIGFGQILDDLDMAFMGAFAVSKDQWQFAADVIYMKLSEENAVALTAPTGSGIPASLSVEAGLNAWILNPNVRYRFHETDQLELSVLAGARYLSIAGDLDLAVASPLGRIAGALDGTNRWWDGVIGISGRYNLTKHWSVPFLADVGTGDSRLTWQALAAVAYRFDSVDVAFGYRHLAWDFKGGAAIESLFVTGPYLAVKFSLLMHVAGSPKPSGLAAKPGRGQRLSCPLGRKEQEPANTMAKTSRKHDRIAAALLATSSADLCAQKSEEEIALAAQNPVAAMVSVPPATSW